MYLGSFQATQCTTVPVLKKANDNSEDNSMLVLNLIEDKMSCRRNTINNRVIIQENTVERMREENLGRTRRTPSLVAHRSIGRLVLFTISNCPQ